MKLFGDKNTFAILYRPDEKQEEIKGNYAFPYCHFILNNQLIGSKDENCFLGTWAASLFNLKKQIILKKNSLREVEFEGLSDLEIIELINKANQTEKEFNSKYLYLSQLESYIWYKYRVAMDETIDGFTIIVLEENNMLKFIWRNELSDNENLGVMATTYEQFINTVDESIEFLVEKYPSILTGLK